MKIDVRVQKYLSKAKNSGLGGNYVMKNSATGSLDDAFEVSGNGMNTVLFTI